MLECEVDVGGGNKRLIKGTEEGNFELCYWGVISGKQKGDPSTEGWKAYKYFANPIQMFERIMKMRISHVDAKNLTELCAAIKEIREQVNQELNLIPTKGA